MRWVSVVLVVAAAAVGTLSPLAESVVAARQATSAATAALPVVGTWRTSNNDPVFYTFSSDGTVIATDSEGVISHGAWRSAGGDEVVYVLETGVGTAGGQGVSGVLTLRPGDDEIGDPYDEAETAERVLPPDPAEFRFAASPVSQSVASTAATGGTLAPTACRVEPRTKREVAALVAGSAPADEPPFNGD